MEGGSVPRAGLVLALGVAFGLGGSGPAAAAPVRECGDYAPGGGAGVFNITARVTSCRTARRMARSFYRGRWDIPRRDGQDSDAGPTPAVTAIPATRLPTCAAPPPEAGSSAGRTAPEPREHKLGKAGGVLTAPAGVRVSPSSNRVGNRATAKEERWKPEPHP